MVAKILAFVLCALPLAALVGIWMLIESGRFERLATEAPTNLDEALSLVSGMPERAPLAPFLALVFALFLISDIRALFHRDPNRPGRVPQAADRPLGFAALRLRRYSFVPFFLAWLFFYCHGAGISPRGPLAVAFVVAFILARRGEDDTYGTMLRYAMQLATAFCEGLSRRHS